MKTEHHSITDAWSGAVVSAALIDAYNGKELSPTATYKQHIEYCMNIDKEQSAAFWKSQLKGVTYEPFPIIESSVNTDYPAVELQGQFDVDMVLVNGLLRKTGATTLSLFRTIMALAIHYFTRSESVIFGDITMGRDGGVEHAERYFLQLTQALLAFSSTPFLWHSKSIPHKQLESCYREPTTFMPKKNSTFIPVSSKSKSMLKCRKE